jgi:hypothetical protein
MTGGWIRHEDVVNNVIDRMLVEADKAISLLEVETNTICTPASRANIHRKIEETIRTIYATGEPN